MKLLFLIIFVVGCSDGRYEELNKCLLDWRSTQIDLNTSLRELHRLSEFETWLEARALDARTVGPTQMAHDDQMYILTHTKKLQCCAAGTCVSFYNPGKLNCNEVDFKEEKKK